MSQPTDIDISAIAKRIRSFGRLPFKFKNVSCFLPGVSCWRTDGFQGEIVVPEESCLCEWCSRLKFAVDSFVVRPEGYTKNPDISSTGAFADESSTSPRPTSPNRPVGHGPRYLGKLSAIRRKKHCPFCRLVLEIVDRPLDQRSPSQSIVEDTAVYARWVIDGQEEVNVDNGSLGQAQFVPRTRRVLIYSEPQAFKDGYIAMLSETAPFKTFFGRRLKSHDLLDPEFVKSWIRKCEHEHGLECEESLVHPDLMRKRKNVLRMIDVEQMCVTEVPQDCRFVALSYLWGKNFEQLFTTSENLPRLSVPGALRKESLPQTIKDSIKLTKMIGEKYLWTDSLALVHDEGFQYHDDWIYARAHLTVIAGSGKDANAGLTGVRKGSRTWHQSIEEVVPGIKLLVTHLAEDYISTSQWDSRAWTFQERMLSRRCLLFVNGRVYFQCRRSTFCEDMELPSPRGWSLDSIDMPTRIFREKPFVQFTSAVELYTRRELTNPVDILDAFAGVQQVLEKRLHTTIYYGLFEVLMDSSLIWESSKKVVRRPNFPSWSWAGWMGEIQWKFTDAVRSWIEWHHAEEGTNEPHHFPQQLVPRIQPPIPRHKCRRKAGHEIRTINKTLPLLHFGTIVATFSLIHPLPVHKQVISPLRKRLTGPSALSTVRPAPADPGLIRTGIADRDGQWCGTIDLDDDKWGRRMGTPLKFLVMSRVGAFADDEINTWKDSPYFPDSAEDEVERFDYGVFNVILVSELNGVFYREAVGRILTGALSRALDPEPRWEDVLLG